MYLKIRYITNMYLKYLKLGTIKVQKVAPLLLILFYPSKAWIMQKKIFFCFYFVYFYKVTSFSKRIAILVTRTENIFVFKFWT